MRNRPQLFCFTYAGGTSTFFNIIEGELEGVELIKFEYAGHGERHKEEYYKCFDELADDLFGCFKNRYNGGDYALFGYSMGSISLVEVLKRIMDTNLKLPSNVFLAAHEPHTKSELFNFSENELDEWVKNRTIKFGAVPDKLLENRVFWRIYLPVFRADYTILRKYQFELLKKKSDIPATVFYSESDTSISEMRLWEKFFPCEFYQFTGNHFFIQQYHAEIARIIKSKIGAYYDV